MKPLFRFMLVVLISAWCVSDVAMAQQRSDNRDSNQSTAPAILFRGISPAGCVQINQRLTVSGANFLSAGSPVVLLRSTTLVDRTIEVIPMQASDNLLEILLPNNPGLQQSDRYHLGIRNQRGEHWSSPALYLSICGANSNIRQSQPQSSTRSDGAVPLTPTRDALPADSGGRSSSDGSVLNPTASDDRPSSNSATVEPDRPVSPDDSTDEEEANGGGNVGVADDGPATDGQNQNDNTPQPQTGGSLSARGIPPAPQLPEINDEVIVEGSIEPEQIVIVAPSMDVSVNIGNQLQALGLSIKTREDLGNLGMVINVFRLPAGTSEADVVNQLRPQLGNQFWIDTNQRYQLLGQDKKRYGQNMISSTGCLIPARIGMVDTLVSQNHPALNMTDITQQNFIDRGERAAPPDHGTAVAGLLAGSEQSGEFVGLLPKSKLFVANAFRARGKEKETTVEWLVLSLDWLAGQQVSVVNLSIGGRRNIILELAVKRLQENGVVVIAAAGNGGTKGEPVYPAAQRGVIAVTAVDVKRRLYRRATRGDYISFAAPGVDIWTANIKGKGSYQSGTSFATPFVTALAAILREKNREAWEKHLQQSAVDLGEKGKDPEFGWGLVQWSFDCE